MFHGGSSILKFSKKSKNFQKSKNAENRSQKYPKVFWTCFGANFFENFLGQCFMEGRFFEKFQKIKKLSKFQPKTHKNRSQKKSISVLNMFWGTFFEKFLTSFPWKDESSRIFEKNQKFSKFQKSRKSLPKVSKRVLNVFWGKFLEKF